jgi:transposase InsO family protein
MLGNCKYIIVVVDYVSKWVEARPCPTTAAQSWKKMFHDIIFPRFRVSKVVTSDGGSHFIDGNFRRYLKAQCVEHRIATPYHPQTSGQFETSNKQIKNIIQKTVHKIGRGWKEKLPKALWAYRTAYKTPINMTPYQLVWEDMPFTRGIGVEITLGYQEVAYGSFHRQNQKTNANG